MVWWCSGNVSGQVTRCGVVVFRECQWAGNTVWCGGVQGRSVGR